MAARTAGEIAFDVVGDTSQLASSIETDLNKAFLKLFVGGSLAAGLVKATGGIRNFVTQGITDMARFETEMTRVFQVLPEMSSSAMDQMAQDITDLSNVYGVEVDKIAQATAVAAGRGIQDLAAFEEATTRLTATVGGDAKNIANVVSSAMNQYGQATLSAAEASDILYQSARNSGLTVDNFGKALYDVLPSAVSLNISLEETAATIATMTAAGTPAAVATTRLRTFLYELGRETTKAGEAFRSVAGMSFTEFINKGGSVAQAIEVMNEAVDKNDKQLRDMVDSFYTADQVIALSGPNAQRYAQALDQIRGSAGAVGTAQEQAFETIEYQLGIARESLRNTRREFTEAFGPTQLNMIKGVNEILSMLVEPVRNLSDAISSFVDEHQEEFNEFGRAIQDAFGQAIQRAATAITILGPIVGSIALNLAEVGEAAANIWRIFSEVFGPITLATTGALLVVLQGITSVMAALAEFVNNNQTAFKALVAAMAGALIALKTMSILTSALAGAKVLLAARALSLTKAMAAVRLAIVAIGWAIRANPIGFLITVVAAAAAAFVTLWKNSETFRRVVVTVVNTAIDGFQMVGKAVWRWMITPLDTLLLVIQKVAEGAGWLLKRVGVNIDGVAGTIANARNQIQGMSNALNALDGLKINVGIGITTSVNGDRPLQGPGLGHHGVGDTVEEINRRATAALSAAIPRPQGSQFSMDKGGGAAKAAENEAKRLADALKRALQNLLDDLKRYADETSKQSVDAIRDNFKSVIESLREARRAANKAGDQQLRRAIQNQIKQFRDENKRLIDMAKQRDRVLERLDIERDRLQEMKEASRDFVESITDSVRSFGSIMNDTGGIRTTFTGMRNVLRRAIIDTERFTTALTQLRRMGLNEASLRQLIEAGPEQGLQQALVLARSGQGGVNQINQLQAHLEAAGQDLATGLNNEFYTAGIQAAAGLVKGLESQEAALVKAMDKLADKLVKSIKKKLKIKSPSELFDEEVGEMIPAGIVRGVQRGEGAVAQAMNRLANVTNTNQFNIEVNGVSDPNAARRAGIMTGSAVVSVLERRKAEQEMAVG